MIIYFNLVFCFPIVFIMFREISLCISNHSISFGASKIPQEGIPIAHMVEIVKRGILSEDQGFSIPMRLFIIEGQIKLSSEEQ